MDSFKDSRYNDVHPTSAIYYVAHASHDSSELDLPSELDSVSSLELLPPSPTAMPCGGYHSALELASLSPMSPTTFSTTTLAVAPYNDGRPRGAPLNTKYGKTSRTAAIDGGVVLVSLLTLCLFVGLAVCLALSIHNQLWDSDLDAVDDGDDGLHLDMFGVPPPLAVSDHEKIREREWQIALEPRQPKRQVTNSPLTLVGDVAVQTTLVYREDDDYEDGGVWTTDVEWDYTDEVMTPRQSDGEDTDPALARRRVHRRHRMSSSKPRSSRGPAKREQRHHYVRRRAVPRGDDDTNDVLVLTSKDIDSSR